MLSDFLVHKDAIGCLLVHCGRGKNRAPSVALAFNDIFRIGYERAALIAQGGIEPKDPNRHVYRTLAQAARGLDLITPERHIELEEVASAIGPWPKGYSRIVQDIP